MKVVSQEPREWSDPDQELFRAVSAAVLIMDDCGWGVTTPDLIAFAKWNPAKEAATLKDCLSRQVYRWDTPGASIAVGMKLHHLRGVVFDGLMLEKTQFKAHSTSSLWRVVRVVKSKSGGK